MPHQYIHTVKSYDIDANRRMTAPALLQVLNEAAMQHVLQLQLSVFDLESHQISWVLLRLEMNILRMPALGETIQITTNPSGFERVFTYRDYRVVDEKGQTLAEAATTWVLFHTASRRPCRIPDWIIERAPPTTLPPLPRPASKLSDWSGSDHGHAHALTVGWHDLDFNWHLNNTHYLRLLLDSMPAEVLQHNTLTTVRLHYQTEAGLGDQLLAESALLSENTYQHRLLRTEQTLASGESIWK